jgi:hypothetical protein
VNAFYRIKVKLKGSDSGVQLTESLDLRTLSIVRNCNKLKNATFRKLGLFPSSDEEREIPTLLGHLGPVIEVSSFIVGSRFSFRHVVFSSYFEFRTMDEVLKPSDSK